LAIKYQTDFNISLSNFSQEKSVKETKIKISDIMAGIDYLHAQIIQYEKYLSNVYEDYLALYILIESITKLALSPEGSLQSYGEEKRKNSSNFKIVLKNVQSKTRYAAKYVTFLDWFMAQFGVSS
jgi:hypothetical protein